MDYARRLRAPLRVIADCGHLLIGERPEAVLAAVGELPRLARQAGCATGRLAQRPPAGKKTSWDSFDRGSCMEQMELVQDPAAADAKVLERLRDLGCDARQARGIRHYIYLPTSAAATAVAQVLEREGWDTAVQRGRGRVARRRRLPAGPQRAARASDSGPPCVACRRVRRLLRRLGGRALTEGWPRAPVRRRPGTGPGCSQLAAAASNGITSAPLSPSSRLSSSCGSGEEVDALRRPPRRPSAACPPRPTSGCAAAPRPPTRSPFARYSAQSSACRSQTDTHDEVRAGVAAAAVHGEQEARHLLVLAHVPQLDLRGEVADEAHVVHAATVDRQSVTKEWSLSGTSGGWTYTRCYAWASSPR